METKICNNCKLEKSVNDYYKDKDKKDGLTTFCITCKKESNKNSRLKNIEVRNKKSREYQQNNKEKISLKQKEYREKNKEKIKAKDKKYYELNREKYLNKYYANRENELIRMKNWKKANRPKLAEYQNKYYKERRKNDELFKIKENIRNLIRTSIKNKGLKKNSKTSEILGCTFEEFKKYLESKFESWMNWDNYGLYNGQYHFGWDIDHIIPNSKAETEEEVLKLNHYTNLQPLCSYTNRDIKIDKLI